jgi:uncharacterized membrane protein YkvA (DUF1232 family)
LVWRLLRDARVPWLNKLVLPGLFLAYLLWPVDLMPDFMPALGQLDDLALLALGMKLFVDLCPEELVRWHRHDMDGGGGADKPPHDAEGEVVDADYRVVD